MTDLTYKLWRQHSRFLCEGFFF